jgi:hypothetical protein
MSVTLTICDETASGRVYHEQSLVFPAERITVRDLIHERIYQEVLNFNGREGELVFHGLVQPTDAERILNGTADEYHLRRHRQIEWKPQFDRAIDAFGHGGFLVLIDDKQAASLDEEFVVRHDTQVSFVKLTPMAAG